MFNRPSSRNLKERLSFDVRSAQRYGSDSEYVSNVRVVVKRLPECSSQQNRVAHRDESWLVSQYRWMSDHQQNGTDRAAVRDVLQACLDEFDAETARELAGEAVTVDTLVDVAHVESLAGAVQDSAVVNAAHLKTPGALRALVDGCVRQIGELRRLAHVARVLSSKAAR